MTFILMSLVYLVFGGMVTAAVVGIVASIVILFMSHPKAATLWTLFLIISYFVGMFIIGVLNNV